MCTVLVFTAHKWEFLLHKIFISIQCVRHDRFQALFLENIASILPANMSMYLLIYFWCAVAGI